MKNHEFWIGLDALVLLFCNVKGVIIAACDLKILKDHDDLEDHEDLVDFEGDLKNLK